MASDAMGAAGDEGGGEVLRRRLTLTLSLYSFPALAAMLLYITALVRMPPDHLRAFFQAVVVVAVLIFPVFTASYHRLYGRLADVLDRQAQGRASQEEVRLTFRDLTDIPRIIFVRGMLMWLIGAVCVVGGTALLCEGLGVMTMVSLVAALLSGGVVLEIVLAFAAKRIAEPYRLRLAAALGDPDLREATVRPLGLSRKLRASLMAVTLVTVAFAILLAQVRSTSEVEAFVARLQATLLARAPQGFEPAALEALRAEALALGAAAHLALLDPASGRVLWGDPLGLAPVELHALVDGAATGDGTGFDSPNTFAWRRLEDGRALVAWVPQADLLHQETRSRAIFAVVMVGSALLAWLASWLLAGDVVRGTSALSRQAEAIARGDLGGGGVFDAEDELGALGRAFDRMRAGLRGMVSSVAETANGVESALGAIASATDQVGRAGADQVRAIGEGGQAIERIHGGARGIAESADALARAVEESTSSAHELGAVGNELGETAAALAQRVDTVSSAVEQMAASIREVARSTDALADAAGETSGSMEEMASSVREVESHAGETARLSSRVVVAAERGRERVAQTIAGMQEIQRETRTASEVIASLGARASEIGGIVEVIAAVADETNLLALNAAIISAQAGERGRAFAVVADQIKSLAHRVLSSTREIEERVRAVQRESRNAVDAIGRGATSVASGVALSAEAGESLEEITAAARESGGRIDEIVAAIREQSKAAAHVVSLMERLQGGLEGIRRASQEQDRGNGLILNEVVDMRHAAERVNATAREQQAGAGRIRDAFETVGSSVESIRQSLAAQVEACARAVELFEGMRERNRTAEASVERVAGASRDLLGDAEALRERVRRFRLDP